MTDALVPVNKTDDVIKNMWKRPGGLFAKITGGALFAGLAYGFYKILPFLIAFTTNIIILICELVVLALLLFLLTNKDVHRWIQLLWLQFTRKIYGAIVCIDPISILDNSIREMKKKLEMVSSNITKLQSLLHGMEKKLCEYKSSFESNVSKKKALESKILKVTGQELLTYRSQLQLVNNNIARGEKQITAQQERITTSKKYLDIMKRLEIAAKYRVSDAESELDYRKDEYEQAKAQQSAVSAISSIMKHGFSKSLEEELAIDQVATTVNDSLAEMSRLIDGSNDILVNFELDSASNSDKADKILQMFEQGGFEIFEQKKIADVVEAKYILDTPSKERVAIEIPYEDVTPRKQVNYFK